MKKFVIIVSAILLSWSAGTAQVKDTQQPVIVGGNAIPLSNSDSVNWRSASNGTIVKIEEDKALPVGCGTDTIYSEKDGVKSDSFIVEVLDSLTWYKNAYKNLPVEKGNVVHAKDSSIPDSVSIALAVFGCVLIVLLVILFILSKKETKKQKAGFQYYINELKQKIAWEQHEKNNWENRANTFSSENRKLKIEIEELRAKSSQNQHKQQGYNEQQRRPLSPPPPQSLYADAIINDKFNRVKEQPDDDTIFELKLSKAGETRAKVVVFEPAHKRVIANPSFLEGCEKQILGNSTVTMQRDGIAQKEDSGKWIITTPPEVKIN